MKQITAQKMTAGGNLLIVYRFLGRKIYIKFNNLKYAAGFLAQIQAKGGRVAQGRNWLEVDMFGSHKTAKLGEENLDLENDSEDKIEEVLVKFFYEKLKLQQFEIKMEEL